MMKDSEYPFTHRRKDMEIYIVRDSRDRAYGWTFDRKKADEQAEAIRYETGYETEEEKVNSMQEDI